MRVGDVLVADGIRYVITEIDEGVAAFHAVEDPFLLHKRYIKTDLTGREFVSFNDKRVYVE